LKEGVKAMLEDLLETLREDPWESVDEEAVLAMQAALAAEEANANTEAGPY
jgi:hypothetical protein